MTEVRVSIDANGAWRLVRTVGAATQTSVSEAGAAVAGQTYHVVPVFPSNANQRLVVNGEEVTLSHTGAAINAPLAFASTDEVAIGNPTRSDLAGFAGDLGRIVMWPLAMSAHRARISYRQQNDLAQWAGVSGENSSGDTNQAPAAVPVNQDVTAGSPSTIDVIARAHDPNGDALSIVSGSLVPSTGSATIASGAISWTPASSALGAHTVGFSLRDGGGKTSSSKVYGAVQPAVVVSNRPKDPPGSTTVWQVPSAFTWAEAYSRASDGHHIEIDGTVSGTINLNRNFNENNPLIIRSRSMSGVTPSGTFSGQIQASGRGHWFYQVRFSRLGGTSDSDAAIQITDGAMNVTRCRFDSAGGIYIPPSPVDKVNIGWNAFIGRSTAGTREASYIFIGVGGNQPSANSFLHNSVIYRNYFDDPGVGGRFTLNFGNSKPNFSPFGHLGGVIIEYNLIAARNARDYAIYLKRACVVQFNDIRMTGALGFRHGFGGKWYGNRSSDDVNFNDGRGTGEFERHDIRGNVLTGSHEIRLFCGSNGSSGNAQHQAASWALLVGNTANVVVGHINSGHSEESNNGEDAKTHDVKVYADNGSYTETSHTGSGNTNTPGNPQGFVIPPTVPPLSVTDVGLQHAGQVL